MVSNPDRFFYHLRKTTEIHLNKYCTTPTLLALFAIWSFCLFPSRTYAIGEWLLNRLENHYRKLRPFEATFIQEIYAPQSLVPSTTASGKFIFVNPCHIKWRYDEPEKQIFVILPGLAWVYAPEDNQVQILDTTRFEKSIIVRAFSDGIIKTFFVTSLQTVREDKNLYKAVVLKPRKAEEEVQEIAMVVNEQIPKIAKIITIDIVGRKNILIFDKEKPLKKVPSSEFAPPNLKSVTVIDVSGNIVSAESFENLLKNSMKKESCNP